MSVGARPTQAEQLYWVLKVLPFFDTLLQDFSIDEHSPNAYLLSPTQNKRFTVPIGYGEPFKKTIHKLLVFIRKQVEQHWIFVWSGTLVRPDTACYMTSVHRFGSFSVSFC